MTTTKSRNTNYDDLTEIKGIGKATARCLRKTLQVYRLKDLIAHSVDEIEAALKDSGRAAVSRGQIEEWITRAKDLNKQPERPHPQDEWTAFASFVVEFQGKLAEDGAMERRTMVHHMKDGMGKTWPSFERVKPWRWMLDRLGEHPKPEPSEQPSERPLVQMPEASQPTDATEQTAAVREPYAPRAVAVEITRIRAFQPPTSRQPQIVASHDRIHSATVRGGQPVSFELSFQLAGPDAADMASKHGRLNAEIYTYNRSTATKNRLCEISGDSAVHDNLSYTMSLPETVLERGTYRLDCVATLEGTPRLNGYLKVPYLQVV